MTTLRKGHKGLLVKRLQKQLKALGYPISAVDGIFGDETEHAVILFQRDNRLDDDGIVGRRTHSELAIELNPIDQMIPQQTELKDSLVMACPNSLVVRICHDSSHANITENWPLLYASLDKFHLAYREMFLMTIATVYVETGRFAPIDEHISHYNTSPNGHPFDKYDDRNDLGNTGKPDGARYKGRGYIQLTGRANYYHIGHQLGLGDMLEQDPERANDPKTAADILACFLKNKESRIKAALKDNDLRDARKAVNGGSHGLTDFKRIYRLGLQLLSAQ
ncbi:peptidoglycan-binding protein [Marinibactrum halimedae]|uniref:Peptidoglycan binding-like domain-containing protein n=1 Tax=Marinibactrum halimedae TaxID=1444977 RepID=A0AA37TAN7_9GAMM|nr:peptidoglycan-binding protein [Marinibactrum halimedae]MCD9458544.1 peptidoglycan-binding protein [Marinibactrum halimedae]GLS26590.1 hypothetical protein GCM10007877_23060 [Marinibactrum halimedae]